MQEGLYLREISYLSFRKRIRGRKRPQTTRNYKKFHCASSRLERMLLRLQNCDLPNKYNSGNEMILADSLSRLPTSERTHLNLDLHIDHMQFNRNELEQIRGLTKDNHTPFMLNRIIIDVRLESRKTYLLNYINFGHSAMKYLSTMNYF